MSQQWVELRDDAFDGGDSAVGAAGNVASVAPWMDDAGSVWRMDGSRARAVSGANIARGLLLPGSEAFAEQKIVLEWEADEIVTTVHALLRFQRTATREYYAVSQTASTLVIRRGAGTTVTDLASGSFARNLAQGHRLELSAQEADGGTLLTARITNRETGAYLEISVEDDHPALQVAGYAGFSSNNPGSSSQRFSRAAVYKEVTLTPSVTEIRRTRTGVQITVTGENVDFTGEVDPFSLVATDAEITLQEVLSSSQVRLTLDAGTTAEALAFTHDASGGTFEVDVLDPYLVATPAQVLPGTTGNAVLLTAHLCEEFVVAGTPGSPALEIDSGPPDAEIASQVWSAGAGDLRLCNIVLDVPDAEETDVVVLAPLAPGIEATGTIGLSRTVPVNHEHWFWPAGNSYHDPAANTRAIRDQGAYTKPPKFTGAAAVLLIDTAHLAGTGAGDYPFVGVEMDDLPAVYTQLVAGQTELELGSGLDPETAHSTRVTFYHGDVDLASWAPAGAGLPPVSSLLVAGMRVDAGASLSAPTLLPGRAWGEGDSIIGGRKAGGTSDTPVTNHLTQHAWFPLWAEAHDCEYTVRCKPGGKWVGNGQGGVPPHHSTSVAASRNWRFYWQGQEIPESEFEGIDYWLDGYGRNDGAAGTSDATTAAAVAAYWAAVRARVGPATWLFQVAPLSGQGRVGVADGFAAYRTAHPGDARARHLTWREADSVGLLQEHGADTPTSVSYDGVHPDYAYHARKAARLTVETDEIMQPVATGGGSGGMGGGFEG